VESLFTGKAKAAKCTFCQDRVYQGLGGPFCATTCPVGALVWGERSELLAQARERVDYLHAEGLTSATLYGEHQAGGLGRLTILFGDPKEYNLSLNLAAPAVSRVWQGIIQTLGALAIGVSALGALVSFFISRTNIVMEEVE
jgi:formate dehydrogenase iron-sulfur subunit